MATIAVVDYGMGNLHSVAKALQHVTNDKVIVADNANAIKAANRVVLPGQGAMKGCMDNIHQQGLYDAIIEAAQSKPFLAICIGPQLLMESSAESPDTNGFAIFKGTCKRFSEAITRESPPLKIPHMGWSEVAQSQSHRLWQGIDNNARFYFVHSYYLVPTDASIVVGQCKYGHVFASALAKDNIFTTQCHPEKSSHVGLRLFKNFTEWKV